MNVDMYENTYNKPLGFTLAELLIALAILGVIATFTIPKILDSGSDSKFNSIAKEAIGMVSGAYQTYKLNGSASASTSFADLTPYMNYVAIVTTNTQVDSTYNSGIFNCVTLNWGCMTLHNGAKLFYMTGGANADFGATSITSSTFFGIDPDGKVTTTGLAGTPGKAIQIHLYYNGRIVNKGTIPANTYAGGVGPLGPDTSFDPPWFSWSG